MQAERERFSPDELAVVLSHYDLGVIYSAKEFARGSRKSPKLLLRADRGRFLLKRRAPGRDDPFKVAFAHALLAHLLRRNLCVPAMVGTRDEHNSMLQLEGRIYELFQFVDGQAHDGSLDQTSSAGDTLGRYHAAVADFRSEWTPPEGSFHDSSAVRTALNSIPSVTASHDSVVGHEAELLGMTQELYERYDTAAEAVQGCGFPDWPTTIIHSDWHPGNMLFRGRTVAAVLDLDSARVQPRVVDVANGMLQFSILRGQDSPADWPEYFDEARMRRFLLGYLEEQPLTPDMRRAVPLLMIESLIAECVVPIAVTGSFGRIPGYGVVQMVRRKVRWLVENARRLGEWMLE
jgi:Ser/Thr protein kinase RdoA (MazF antagonist)